MAAEPIPAVMPAQKRRTARLLAPRPRTDPQGKLDTVAGLRRALLADVPPTVRDLARAVVECPGGLRVFGYVADHGNAALQAEDLAALADVPYESVVEALALLHRHGLVTHEDACGLRFYRYRLPEDDCAQARALYAWRAGWLGRWHTLGLLLGAGPWPPG